MRSGPSRSPRRMPTPPSTPPPQERPASRKYSFLRKLLVEESAHIARVDTGVDECCADPAHQNECGHSALYFLVLRHQIDQPVDRRQFARNVLRPGGQADLGQMANGAVRFGGRQQTAPRGKLERQRHSRGHRFAVQKPPGKTGRRLQCMPEGVTEIEQLPIAGLTPTTRDNRRLGAPAYGNGVLACWTALKDLSPVCLQPGKERGVAEQTVFDDLRIA